MGIYVTNNCSKSRYLPMYCVYNVAVAAIKAMGAKLFFTAGYY